MTARVLFPFDMSGFFFSFLLSESSETFRMFPYDCINRFRSFAEIMADIFCLAPTALTRQR